MNILENDFLSIAIASKGAELKSVVDKNKGYEFLWQAEESIWGRTAPVLFPVVGKPFNNELLINEKNYAMPQHGFARDMNFEVYSQSKQQLVFRLVSNEETFAKFPFHFELLLSYTLVERSIVCGYEVKNTDAKKMYFSIGAHPGFKLPTNKLDDYVIKFDQPENAERVLLSDGLLNNKQEKVLDTDQVILLHHSLFDKDAIVFKHLHSNSLTLASKHTSYAIKMAFEGFPYYGIWCKKGCESFICLEPWCGIAGSVGEQLPIEEKEGINLLEPNTIFERKYSITFNSF